MTDPNPLESSTQYISVFGREEGNREERSLFKRKDDFRYGSTEIPVDEFRQRVDAFMTSIEAVIANVKPTTPGYHLDEIAVKVEVSAKGHLSILGTGGELGGTGGLTFTFKKTP